VLYHIPNPRFSDFSREIRKPKVIYVLLMFLDICHLMKTKQTKTQLTSQAPVVHACNPSNSRGRDQENCGSKPAWANSLRDISQNTQCKKGLVEWLK
jgi:hypothetical protein